MSSKPIYRLYYWPHMPGRGEYIRLILEEAKTPYENVRDEKVLMDQGLAAYGPPEKKFSTDSFPHFAMPLLEHIESGFRLSQCAIICKYLAGKYGMLPDLKTEEEMAQAEQLNLTIHDYVLDGNFAFHMKDFHAAYEDQVEYTKPYLEKFVADRMPKWLGVFERALAYNKSKSGYLFGHRLSYVDLALLGALRVTEADFPEVWAKLNNVPKLKEFKANLEKRENLAAYFKSDRCMPFPGHSFM